MLESMVPGLAWHAAIIIIALKQGTELQRWEINQNLDEKKNDTF